MRISDALSAAAALTGQSIAAATAVRWLSELDGRLALELFGADVFTPYDAEADAGTELLVPFPWDGLYVHHLEALTYFTDGEYDRYEPARVMSEQILADYKAFLRRTREGKGADLAGNWPVHTVRAVDTAPAAGSTALITSGAVYAAIGAAMGGSY